MKLIKDCYAELLNLTQLYLLREYSLQETKMVDPTIIKFFQGKLKQKPHLPPRESQKLQPPPVATLSVQSMKASTHNYTPLPDPRPPEPPPAKPTPPPTQPEPTTPPPSPPIAQDKIAQKKGFTLEPFPVPPPQEHTEWWTLCKTLFPEWVLCKTIPSDDIAQKNKNQWMNKQEVSPILILAFHEHEQQLIFLKNIARAISLRLAPAQVVSAARIEKEDKWEHTLNSPHLRLVIASDYGLYLHSKLMRFYRELPQQGKHFLHHTPLLLLSDLSLYLKEPQLKPLLWRAICNEFAASSRSPSL